MRRKLYSVFLTLTLASLALAIKPASAGSPVDVQGPEVAACQPGTGYASGCDVNQDDAINILDVQLTASHWNSSGTYVPATTIWARPGPAPTIR